MDAWISGLRRDQSPSRADDAQARVGRQARAVEGQPAGRLERGRRLALHRRARRALQPAARPGLLVDRLHPLHDAGHRPRRPLGGRRQDRVRHPRDESRALLPAPAGGRGDLRRPRGRGRARAPGAAVLGRQGLGRAAAHRREGVRARAHALPGHARRHGPQLPGGPRLPRPPRRRARRAAHRRAPCRTRSTPAASQEEPGVGAVAQPPADHRRCSTRSPSTASTPRSAAPGATRSARAPRSASCPSATSFGQWDPRASGRSCGASTTAASGRGEHVRVFPLSNWTELDIWRYIAAEELELPSIYFAHERERLRARRDAARRHPVRPAPAGEEPLHRRRCATAPSATSTCTGAVARARATLARRRRRDRRHARSPSAARRARTTGVARPRWRTASARATSDGPATAPHASRPPELLRVATAGSVDDGKSHADRAAAARHQVDLRRPARGACSGPASSAATADLDLALLTDGLRAEREQGITIDVAYRYFATPQRSFILADTPGHVQLHAQHGHRRVDRRPRARADRRAQGRARAVAPARVHRVAAPRPAHRRRRQQDGPRRLRRGRASREIADEFRAFAAQAGRRRRRRDPDLRAAAATTSSSARDAMPTGTTGRRCCAPRGGRRRRRPRRHARPPAGPVRRPPARRRAPRLPRLRREVAGGTLSAGEDVVVLPGGARSRVARHRHVRRPARRGGPADVGDGAPRRRPRRLPRRDDRPPARPPPAVVRELVADVCWFATRRCAGGRVRRSSTRPARRARWSPTSCTRRRRHAATATPSARPAGAQRHRPAAPAHHRRRSRSTPTRRTAPPARSSSSTSDRTRPSPPGWSWRRPASPADGPRSPNVRAPHRRSRASTAGRALGRRGATVWLTGLPSSGKSTVAVGAGGAARRAAGAPPTSSTATRCATA